MQTTEQDRSFECCRLINKGGFGVVLKAVEQYRDAEGNLQQRSSVLKCLDPLHDHDYNRIRLITEAAVQKLFSHP